MAKGRDCARQMQERKRLTTCVGALRAEIAREQITHYTPVQILRSYPGGYYPDAALKEARANSVRSHTPNWKPLDSVDDFA